LVQTCMTTLSSKMWVIRYHSYLISFVCMVAVLELSYKIVLIYQNWFSHLSTRGCQGNIFTVLFPLFRENTSYKQCLLVYCLGVTFLIIGIKQHSKL
jgi:hypothetical protein